MATASTSSSKRPWPFALVGLVLSCYALHVEQTVSHKPPEELEDYQSLCDIEQIGASCSNVFQLPEGRMLSLFGIVPDGHMLDVPNAALGCIYYTVWLLLFPTTLLNNNKQVQFMFCSCAMLSSVFLAYKLTVLKELCILCWSTHVINTRLWWNSYSNLTTTANSKKSGGGGGGAKIKRV